MRTKEYFINEFLKFTDKENVDEYISCLEAYISENEYDMQLELILYAYQKYKINDIENCYEKACEVVAPVFDLLKNTEWGWLEIQVLASVIGNVPHYTMGEALMNKAFKILDNEFIDHENHEYTKLRFYFNFSWRLLRARYYDNANPADIQAKFDRYFQQAISLCEKYDYITVRTVLLVRQAIFYGDSKKILEYLDALKVTGDKMWLRTTKDEVVEYFQRLGGKATIDLKNLIVGWQIYKRRKELGMSIEDLADAIDAPSIKTMYVYERGVRGVGSERLCKIAEALGVDMSYFYGGPDTEPANITTDIATHKMGKLMSQMSEKEKEYLLDNARGLIKLHKKKDEDEQ